MHMGGIFRLNGVVADDEKDEPRVTFIVADRLEKVSAGWRLPSEFSGLLVSMIESCQLQWPV
jgi:hypothetical protein